jgi:hypothetical protein
MAVYTPSAFTSAAVQTACTTAYGNGGGIVYCAEGIYQWTSELIVKSGVRVIGDGWGNGTDGNGTVFKQDAGVNMARMVSFYTSNGTDANAHNAGLHSLRIDGDKANNSTGNTIGINAVTNPLWTASTNDNASVGWDMHHMISKVHVWNCDGDGFFANGRSELQMTDCFIRNCANGFNVSADSTLKGCVAGVNDLAGFKVDGQASVRLEGCKSWYSGRGSTPTATLGYGFWINNNTSGCVVMAGCEAQDNADAGLYINGSKSVNCQGFGCDSNSFRGAGVAPAVLINNSYGCIVDVCCMERQTTPTQTYVLKLTGGSTGNMVRGTNHWITTPASAGAIDPASTNTNNDLIITKLNGSTTTTTRVTMA